jgi:hypothetical protein
MHALALALIQTDDTQAQANHIAGIMAGMGAFFLFFGLIVTAFFIFCLWRIFTKAGMAGALSLIAIIPGIGGIIVICLLAFGKWNVIPAPYAAVPPAYPPTYPPAGPPTV